MHLLPACTSVLPIENTEAQQATVPRLSLILDIAVPCPIRYNLGSVVLTVAVSNALAKYRLRYLERIKIIMTYTFTDSNGVLHARNLTVAGYPDAPVSLVKHEVIKASPVFHAARNAVRDIGTRRMFGSRTELSGNMSRHSVSPFRQTAREAYLDNGRKPLVWL